MYKVHPRFLLPGLLLFALLAYLPGLHGPFIFDDAAAITSNPHLDIDPTVADEWRTAAVSSNSGRYRRPIAMWSFTVNHVIADGNSSFGIKLGNLLIHLLCGLIVYYLAKSLLSLPGVALERKMVVPAALLACALWLLHPLQVSTVLYAVQRMAQLSTLFCLGGLLVFVRARSQWAEQGAPPGEILSVGLWLLLFTQLAVLSKENGLLLLWLIPVVEVSLYRGRWAGETNRAVARFGWLALLLPIIFLTFVLLVTPQVLIGGYASREFSLEERLLTQARTLWTYLYWFLVPNIDVMGFQHDDITLSRSLLNPATTLLSVFGWIGVLWAAMKLRHRFPLLMFALLFYLVGHSMESSVIPLEMVYEHRNYLPLIGIAVLLATAITSILARLTRVRPRVVMLGLAIVLGGLTGMRATVWSDEQSLTLVNSANHPGSARSHFFYATHHLRRFEEDLEVDRVAAWEHMLAARAQIEMSYLSREQYFPALVILFWLDSYYFPDLALHEKWLEELEDASGRVKLSASVRMALESLVDCFADRLCDAPPDRLFKMLANFEGRFPRSPDFALLRHRYYKRADESALTRMTELDRAESLAPYATRIYRLRLMDLADTGDVAEMYDTVKRWMAHDPHRRELQDIKALFASPADSAQVP